ncbi:DedA family protein [Ectobacillus antri]|uniref:DedA family protein n=1 Tax=Ectobacillus antri TaxID=2486280 RepID=A0ABT6H562_9BACI|nr:DedA family protein [Ectobacillus antri]MDG4656778.1 DedA family protein [Ectobacillus antri]MDG5753859.1 DedA family protein [Ectobacillus antri]
MEQLILSFIEFFKQFSYAGIVLALTFEFVPAELVLPLVGYWVYQGDMNLIGAVIAGTIGGTTGPLTLYALGYYGGRPLIKKYGKYFFVKEKELEKAEAFFEKHGPAVAFLGRFVPGIRTLISIPCGVAKMNVWQFSIYTFLAMLPVTALYIYLGMKLGEHWQMAGEVAKEYLLPIGIIIIGIVLIMSVSRYIKAKKAQEF